MYQALKSNINKKTNITLCWANIHIMFIQLYVFIKIIRKNVVLLYYMIAYKHDIQQYNFSLYPVKNDSINKYFNDY
jgi:hypothetical protein